MKEEKNKECCKNKNTLVGRIYRLAQFEIDKRYLIILAIAVIIFIPYISKKFILGHDYVSHASNVYAMDKSISIKDHNFFPSKIRPVIANEMGYGNGIFYPQLSYCIITYLYVILKHIGMSMITCIKIFEFIVVLLSGILMYKFMNETFKNRNISLVSSILYMCAPYFVSDVFIRMAYAEILIFLFMPIVMLSINYIFNKQYSKFIICFVIGYCGMICSHLVLTVFFTILLSVVLLVNIRKILNKKTIMMFLLGTLMVIGITSPFLIPMLEHKIKGNYVVFSDDAMTNIYNLKANSFNLYDITDSRYNHRIPVTVHTSFIVIILMLITFWYHKKVLKEYTKEQKGMFWAIIIFTVMGFFLGSELLNWEKVPKILWSIQFPWRNCAFIAFGTSIIAGISIQCFKGDSKKVMFIIMCYLCLLDVNNTIEYNMINLDPITYNEVKDFNSPAMGAQKEYLPVSALNNIQYLEKRDHNILIKNGNANAKIEENKVPYLEFDISMKKDNLTTVEIPRLFYYGYEIKFMNSEGVLQRINYYENENGFIEFDVDKSGKVIVDYKGTILNNVSNVVSIILIVGFTIYIYKYTRSKRKNENSIKHSKMEQN